MKTSAERGPIGAWAYDARADADLSVEEVVDRLARIGHPVTAATVRGIEGGSKKPGRGLIRALAKVYGKMPPAEADLIPEIGELAVLADAIEHQAVAIEALIRRFEELADRAIRDGIEDALREAVEGQGAGASPDEPPPAPSP